MGCHTAQHANAEWPDEATKNDPTVERLHDQVAAPRQRPNPARHVERLVRNINN